MSSRLIKEEYRAVNSKTLNAACMAISAALIEAYATHPLFIRACTILISPGRKHLTNLAKSVQIEDTNVKIVYSICWYRVFFCCCNLKFILFI